MRNLDVETRPLQTIRICSISDLAPFLDSWRDLAAGAPMRSPEWLLAWWEFFAAANDELWVLLIREPAGVVVGLAPLYLQDAGRSATLRLLGARDACTHHNTCLAATGWEKLVGEEVGRFLLSRRQNWKRLFFEAIDADDMTVDATMQYLAANGCLGHRRQINSCWHIDLPPSWNDYLGMLSRSLRKRCRKLQRQFFDSGKIQICQVEREADLEQGFSILLKLHDARWGNARKRLGVFSDERFRRFHERVAKYLLARGQLRLAWLECNGQPLAVEYQFVDSRVVYAYQAGIDLTMDEYPSGKLSMMAAIQFAIARGCESFDLLGGDEPYKANWRAVPVACHDLRVWPKRGTGVAEWVMWNAYTRLARRLEPIIPTRFITGALGLCHRGRKVLRGLRRQSGQGRGGRA